MGALAFFPWVTVTAPAAVGRYRLVPHRVGASLQAEPRVVDGLLSAWTEPGGGPVESATLVHLAGQALTADLSPRDEAGLHQLAAAVALAALARRSFFDGPYLNAEHLRFELRRFTGTDPRNLQVVARRRDGRRWVAHGTGGFRTARPPHAPRPPPLDLDEPLVAAVTAAPGTSLGAPLLEAIAAFLAASGDGDGISPAGELFFLRTALERIAEAPGPEDLAPRLLELLGPFVAGARAPRRLATVRRLELAAEPGRPPSASIAEAWIRDLTRACRSSGPPAYWAPAAHLLVGAHLFPLAVMVRLARAGLRPLAAPDRTALLAFPYLAALRDPFARRRSLAARDPHLYGRALQVAGRRRAQLQLAEVLERTRGGGG
ncbi:MAG TPA: hypothetical protein VMU15_03350 [Anaeromyxobacter sp.]|nr:hypothetical protein [Anaeromyxobacter sp.]